MREAPSTQPIGLAVKQSASRRPLVTVKDLLWLVYLYPLRLLAAVLPIPLFRLLTSLVDVVSQQLTGRLQRSVLRHLDAVEQSGGLSRPARQITHDVISRAVRRSMDDLILHRLAAKGLRCSAIQGRDHLDVALGKGVIILSAHTYANRLGKRHLDQLGYPVMSVRNQRPPDSLMGRLGERFLHRRYLDHLHGVIRDETFIHERDCALTILKRLRSGGIVHIYLDAGVSALRSNDQETAVYWGHFLASQRPFPTGFMRIARATGCAVVPMICLGDSRGFTIGFDSALDLAPDADTEALISTHLPRLVAELESKILKTPDQWEFWAYSNEHISQ